MAKVREKIKARGKASIKDSKGKYKKRLVSRAGVGGGGEERARLDGKAKIKAKITKISASNNVSTTNNTNNSSTTLKQIGNNTSIPRAIIPFRRNDRILLVGEGDLSFALSLATHHLSSSQNQDHYYCPCLLATTFDSRADLLRKYPQAERNVELLERMNVGGPELDHGQSHRHSQGKVKVLYDVDATRLGKYKEVKKGFKKVKQVRKYEAEIEPGSDLSEEADDDDDEEEEEEEGTDADADADGKWDRIVFNFPHVGGKSTDVNRQVRYNQELIKSFLNASIPLLALKGAILVTIFEGMPYTLWNIHDLARHVGLRVARSFRFLPDAYPGYQHARTIGNILGKDGKSSRRGWKGEERESRMYAFVLKDGVDVIGGGFDAKKKHKRKRGSESSGDSDC